MPTARTARLTGHDWPSFLQRFHAERAGITERILGRCTSNGHTPYAWCAEPLSDRIGPTLDIACGSGPMAAHVDRWVGADLSEAELALAAAAGRTGAMRASAVCLPVRTGQVDAVVCSMGLQLIEPIDLALAEVARVLRSAGRVALLVPASAPMPLRDALVYMRLQVALRQRIRYPNDHDLRPASLRAHAKAADLDIVSDERRAFTLPLRTTAEADELLASLYLLDVSPGRLDAGRRVLRGAVHKSLTVPLRRVVLEHRAIAA